MSYIGIDHKLRVFISSRCGGKYTIARKALKKLLEATGLVDVYTFETEPASSENTRSSYLEQVDNSNLCIFLIDNADGVSPAVLSEEKRAKDKQLRLLYIFCDENKKTPTPMQEGIKNYSSQKYKVVHEFSDMVSAAYDSLLQDIVSVYKIKKDRFLDTTDETALPNIDALNIKTYSLSSACFAEFPLVARVLTEKVLPDNSLMEKKEKSLLEDLLAEQIKVVLYQKSFDVAIIDDICKEGLKNHNGGMSDLLKLRYQAQKCYYQAEYDNCLVLLQCAIEKALNSDGIPAWIANDIAIDIRHVQGQIDIHNNQITFENPGQKYIDASDEPVYFPYLDRQVEIMQEEIAKKYYNQLNISPYTTTYGGMEQVFSALANAFCIAEIHGSIVQTEITRDRLISIYSMLCTLYEDHDFIVEYVRLIITNRESKKLDNIIRTYNQTVDILNDQDIDVVLGSIKNIGDPLYQEMAKYLLASRLGHYMKDNEYEILYKELVTCATKWVEDDKRVSGLSTYIFDFYRLNTQRANGKDIVDFICSVFEHNLSRTFSDCFKVLRNLDFSTLEQEDHNRIKQLLIDIMLSEKDHIIDQYYSSTVIRFCKSTMLPYEDIETNIAQKYPVFYKNDYLLEMSAQREQDLSEYVELYLEEAQARNKTQGENGKYAGYAHESLDVIYSILKTDKCDLDEELLISIIDVVIETLSAEKQTVSAKLAAVKLLQLLYCRYKEKNSIWSGIREQMENNISTYSNGFEMGFLSKDTSFILSFAYDLFVSIFMEVRRDLLLEKLYSIDISDSYTIIMLLRVITVFLEDTKGQWQNENLISAFLYYSIFMTQQKERDVRRFATNCLIELTEYKNTRHLALIHLSQIMDTGKETEKLAILTRISKIQVEDEAYLEQILNKGKSDNNYLVRYVAQRESQRIVNEIAT